MGKYDTLNNQMLKNLENYACLLDLDLRVAKTLHILLIYRLIAFPSISLFIFAIVRHSNTII